MPNDDNDVNERELPQGIILQHSQKTALLTEILAIKHMTNEHTIDRLIRVSFIVSWVPESDNADRVFWNRIQRTCLPP